VILGIAAKELAWWSPPILASSEAAVTFGSAATLLYENKHFNVKIPLAVLRAGTYLPLGINVGLSIALI